MRVKGEVEEKDKIHIPRAQLLKETKEKIEQKGGVNNVWEVGYWSTDDEEDNDSDYDGEKSSQEEDEEEYDEEEEEEEEEKDEDKTIDPTEKIR